MTTQAEIAAGAAALQAYVESVDGFEASFIPSSDYNAGAATIINAANASADQSFAGRQGVGGVALYKAITAQGYGDKVTPAQCEEAAGKVLEAI